MMDPETYCETHVLQKTVTLPCLWQHVAEYDLASSTYTYHKSALVYKLRSSM